MTIGSGVNVHLESKRFAKFLVVGAIGAVVDFGSFNLLTAVFHLPPVPSSVASFLAAVTSNFIFNRYWTYPDSRSKPVLRQVIQFTFVNLVGLLIRTPLFAAMIPVWRGALEGGSLALPFPAEQLSRNLALGCAVLVVLVWNFVINRIWTYNDVQ
ncbi:MAG: GtrA family protein [Anaerolineales bacterium]|nr:GtrA family protein [Anaerolineales bacterium]